NMETLSQAVMSEARTEADQILVDARVKADAIRQGAQEQVETQRKSILDEAGLEAERTRRQVAATAQIKARAIQLESREKVLTKVFETAQQQLTSVQQWSDYDKTAASLLREAMFHLGASRGLVFADEATRQYLTADLLDKISKDLNIELVLKEPLASGTGVIVETEDGRRRYDNTLETRLSRMQDALRAPVYHLLMGESL
ncbi:MAG TPA: V-type ATP synthase subunit E family protein, partial [Anaerolineaceae bacterium]